MMKFFIVKFSVFFIIITIFSGRLVAVKDLYLNLRSSFDTSGFLDELDENQVPTLENLFQKPTYWDINNVSSPCKYYGYKRNFLCQKIISFDKEGYEKSLQDTRKLFLSRLGNRLLSSLI